MNFLAYFRPLLSIAFKRGAIAAENSLARQNGRALGKSGTKPGFAAALHGAVAGQIARFSGSKRNYGIIPHLSNVRRVNFDIFKALFSFIHSIVDYREHSRFFSSFIRTEQNNTSPHLLISQLLRSFTSSIIPYLSCSSLHLYQVCSSIFLSFFFCFFFFFVFVKSFSSFFVFVFVLF